MFNHEDWGETDYRVIDVSQSDCAFLFKSMSSTVKIITFLPHPHPLWLFLT